MFCHKCGQQASEGAAFCRNCGAKLRGEEPAEELFDVTLFFVEPVRKVQVIKVVREWTGLGLAEAKELVEKAPVLLRRSVTRKEAEFIKPILAKAGASLVFTDQSGNQVSITVPCKRCGAPLDEWSTTCRVCGNTVEIPSQYETKPADADASGTRASGADASGTRASGADASGTGTSSAGTSSTSTAVVAIGAVLVLLVKVVGSLMAVAAVVAIVTAVTENGLPDEIRQLVEPGMEVRGAYLTQYSDEVTVGKAFDDFFANEKWSTYSSEGYSYVVFTGACEYLGERADVRVTFKITGEKFLVDTLDINGREQSKLMLYGLLEKIYEDY